MYIKVKNMTFFHTVPLKVNFYFQFYQSFYVVYVNKCMTNIAFIVKILLHLILT